MTHPTYPTTPRRRTSPLVVLAVIAAGLVALAIAGVVVVMAVGDGGETAAGNAPAAATHEAGSTATDSKFTFRVTAVDTARRVKSESGSVLAKGRFVEVWVAVTNRAAKARFISADDQELHAGGRSYSVNVNATVEVDEGPEIGLPEKISGGDTETLLLVFDVPETAKPATLEVHGSEVSGGALLALPGT